MTLDQLLIRASETAADIFAQDGYLCPVWIGQTAQGDIVPVVGYSPDGPDDMAAMIESTRQAFAQFGVIRYVSMVEGYALEGDAARKFNGADHIADHPDGRHCVHLLAIDMEGNARAAVRYVLKPDAPKAKAKLSELQELPRHYRPAGLMAQLLQPANAGSATRH